jgi:integrase
LQRSFPAIERKAWTAEQLRTFLHAAAGHRLFPALWLAASTGMRRSELLGLQWSDINYDRARLSINRGLVAIGYELHESRCKTANSRRTIDIDPSSLDILRGWQTYQAAELAAVGVDNTGRMFTDQAGGPVHPHAISQAFDRIVRRAGVPIIPLRGLRHTHGSLLIEAGVRVKVVSERLGHARQVFTIETYQHVLPWMQAAAAATFQALMAPPVPPATSSTGPDRRNTRGKSA